MAETQDTDPKEPLSRRSLLTRAVRKGLEALARQTGARLRTIDELGCLDDDRLFEITPIRGRQKDRRDSTTSPIAVSDSPEAQSARLLLLSSDGRRSLLDMAATLAREQDLPMASSRREIRQAFLDLAHRGLVAPHGDVPEVIRAEGPALDEVVDER